MLYYMFLFLFTMCLYMFLFVSTMYLHMFVALLKLRDNVHYTGKLRYIVVLKMFNYIHSLIQADLYLLYADYHLGNSRIYLQRTMRFLMKVCLARSHGLYLIRSNIISLTYACHLMVALCMHFHGNLLCVSIHVNIACCCYNIYSYISITLFNQFYIFSITVNGILISNIIFYCYKYGG